MADHRLFVYGTLQLPALLHRLLGRVPERVPAELADHRAAPIAGQPYPGLVREPGARARGMVVAVDTAELAVLDRFEGPDYTRVAVRPVVDGGETVDAEAWLLTGALPTAAGDWDLAAFERDHAGRFVGGSRSGRHHPRD